MRTVHQQPIITAHGWLEFALVLAIALALMLVAARATGLPL
jgi:hypothetical protein